MKMSIKPNLLRQIIRTLDNNISLREVGRVCHVSPNTAKSVRNRLQEKQLTWEMLREKTDIELQLVMKDIDKPAVKKYNIDWLTIQQELKKKDVTLQLLWEEYRSQTPDGISYPQFTRLYQNWNKKCKLSMRQAHVAGEKIFVDFCGRTIPIKNAESGQILLAQVFVGVLGASGYIFATAVSSQKTEDWLAAHESMLRHLGGIPRYIVPDNLKSGVLQNNKSGILLNQAYQEFAEHYDFIVFPARPRKPKDKSLGEIGVQIVQRFVLARLRNQIFFSLDEFNKSLAFWMKKLNDRTTKTYLTSRTQRLSEIDTPAMSAIRVDPYPYSRWKHGAKVDESYHVEYERHFYSVPFSFAHLRVDIRANKENVYIFHQRRLIAQHPCKFEAGRSTLNEHLPRQHQAQLESSVENLLDWAESVGSATSLFFKRSFGEKRHFAGRLRAAQTLKRDTIAEKSHDRVEAACRYSLSLNCISFDRLRTILRTNADLKFGQPNEPKVTLHENLRGADYYNVNNGKLA